MDADKGGSSVELWGGRLLGLALGEAGLLCLQPVGEAGVALGLLRLGTRGMDAPGDGRVDVGDEERFERPGLRDVRGVRV
jgi:hypothetical protein